MSDVLADYLGRFAERVILEAMAEATAAYWRRRAATFEAARPRPGDYPGRATAAELTLRDHRLAEAAAACRERARFLEDVDA